MLIFQSCRGSYAVLHFLCQHQTQQTLCLLFLTLILNLYATVWLWFKPVNSCFEVFIIVVSLLMCGYVLMASGNLKSPWCRKRRKCALSPQKWKNSFTPDGKLHDGGIKLLKKVRSGVSCCICGFIGLFVCSSE